MIPREGLGLGLGLCGCCGGSPHTCGNDTTTGVVLVQSWVVLREPANNPVPCNHANHAKLNTPSQRIVRTSQDHTGIALNAVSTVSRIICMITTYQCSPTTCHVMMTLFLYDIIQLSVLDS